MIPFRACPEGIFSFLSWPATVRKKNYVGTVGVAGPYKGIFAAMICSLSSPI